jgi:hypothetical protein
MYTHRYLIFDGLAVVGSIESNMEDMFVDNMLSENASTLISHTDDPRTRSPVHVASGRGAEEERSRGVVIYLSMYEYRMYMPPFTHARTHTQ